MSDWADRVDTLPGTYTRAMYPAEFWDSVLVVPDVGERLLWRIDMAAGTRTTLGSMGGGPGEYARVSWALKVHRDSVAISPGMAWMPFPVLSVATGAGRTVSFRPNSADDDRASAFASIAQPFIALADTLGNLYGEAAMRAPSFDSTTQRIRQAGGVRDTSDIRRFSTRTLAVDTLMLFPRGVHYEPPGQDATGAMALGLSLGSYGPSNGWTVAEDGRLLLVDAATYELRVLDRNLEPISTWRFLKSAIPVSQAGWDDYVKQSTRGSIALMEKTMEQVLGTSGAKRPRPAGPRYVVPTMPDTLPPVRTGGVTRPLHVVDNTAWIPVNRVDPPGAEFWDILDIERGTLLVTLALPANHRLLHVTRRGAYILAKDDDDLERILLYRQYVNQSPP